MSTTITDTIHQIGKHRIHLLETGQRNNPALLLIHGGLGDAELHWRNNLDTLGKHFNVYAPDLPGFGNSIKLDVPSIPNYLTWINDLLHHLELEEVTLIGNSFGAMLSYFYTITYPAQVEHLILIDGTFIGNIPAIMRIITRIPLISNAFFDIMLRQEYSRSGLKKAIYHQDLLTDNFLQVAQQGGRAFIPALRHLINDPWPTIRTPGCPTLIIWGLEDKVSPVSEGRQLLHEIPHAQFLTIEEAGHLPMLEQPDAFHKAVMDFLGEQ